MLEKIFYSVDLFIKMAKDLMGEEFPLSDVKSEDKLRITKLLIILIDNVKNAKVDNFILNFLKLKVLMDGIFPEGINENLLSIVQNHEICDKILSKLDQNGNINFKLLSLDDFKLFEDLSKKFELILKEGI